MSRDYGIGPVPEGVDENLRDFLQQLRRATVQSIRTGTPSTTGALTRSGALDGFTGGVIGGGFGSTPDLTPPPTPSGVSVGAGIDFVSITTDPPTFLQGRGYNRTIVYGAKYPGTGPLPTFASAVKVHEFVGQVGSFSSEPATQWHLWLKWRTNDGVESVSPSGGTNGHQTTTGQDVTKLLEALSGAITRNEIDAEVWRVGTFAIGPPAGSPLPDIYPFIVQTTPTTINGQAVPAGVYMDTAFVRDGTIVTAKIGDAAITNAKVQSLSATKLTAGTIAVGEEIKSSNFVSGLQGWMIHGNGGAEFGFANIRGTLAATQIAANTIAADKLQAWSITATQAIIANASIGTAQIADLSVDSLKIANNAVSVPVGADLSTDFNPTGISEQDMLVVGSINTGGAPIVILATICIGVVGDPTSSAPGTLRLKVGSTVVWSLSPTAIPSATYYREISRNIYVASPGSGSVSIRLTWEGVSGSGSYVRLKADDATNDLSGTTIVAIGLKK